MERRAGCGGKGLTRYEAEGAFSLGLVRHAKINPETIWELKAQTLKKSGLLSLYRGGERFEDLMECLDSLKSVLFTGDASTRKP